MSENKKIKVEIELDKEEFQAACYFMGHKLTDEVYDILTETPIRLNVDKNMKDESKNFKIMLSVAVMGEICSRSREELGERLESALKRMLMGDSRGM